MPAQSRIGDSCQGVCSHGCPVEPHIVIGNAISGSPDVLINGMPAFRQGDNGIHAACCGPNTFKSAMGSSSVMVNGKPAVRMGDSTSHCGGMGSGSMTVGSPNVMTGG